MYNKHQDKPSVITWRQFSNKGYSAFASLHRQVRIGVLSVATLAVAAQAHARLNDTVVTPADEKETIDEGEMAEVTVSGTLAPLTQLQSARIVSVLSRQDIEQAAVQSINDLFKLVTGVDVRQRGGFGIQTDISIDGGTFDQVTLLLNGIDIGNPQTGHLSADFPVSISDIERIEVLEGAASRVYGGQSFGGAINIVTRHDTGKTLDLSASGGSFGTAEGEARLALTTGKVNSRISGGGGRSDGGTQNSSWKEGQLYYQGDFENQSLRIDWQLGYSQKSYGANTFYSAAYPDQYERNRRLMTSVSAETKGRFHFTPQVFWNRNYDNFELVHGTTFGENFHRLDVYGIKAGGHFDWVAGLLSRPLCVTRASSARTLAATWSLSSTSESVARRHNTRALTAEPPYRSALNTMSSCRIGHSRQASWQAPRPASATASASTLAWTLRGARLRVGKSRSPITKASACPPSRNSIIKARHTKAIATSNPSTTTRSRLEPSIGGVGRLRV